MRVRLALPFLLALGPAAPLLGAESAALRNAREAEQGVEETMRAFTPAFVFVGGGSGVIISADGLMLTNHHVVGASQRWQVRVGEKIYRAKVLGHDPRGDISLLQLENASGLPHVEFADSDRLAVGRRLLAIGNPFAAAEMVGDPSVTLGVVSCLHRFQGGYSDAIQTDAPINPGNSGGPLLTLDGRLAGINGRIQTRFGNRANSGIGMAIPANQISRFLPALRAAQGRFVFHGLIRGLEGDREEKDNELNGAEIKSVQPGSAAEKLGLRAGDRITHLNDAKLLNYNRFLGVLGTYPAGSRVTLRYVRERTERRVEAELESLNPGGMGFSLKTPRSLRDPVIVEKVQPKLAGDLAGLKAGDRILAFEGAPTETIAAWLAITRRSEYLAGDKVKLKVRRNGAAPDPEMELTLNSLFDEPGFGAPRRRPPRRP
jgi:serine protease DegQ